MSDRMVVKHSEVPKVPTKRLSSFFFGWAVSFLLLGGSLALWRFTLSSKDGTEMLIVCSLVFFLQMVAAVVAAWLTRKSIGQRSNLAIMCGLVFSIATAASLHAIVPMSDWNQKQREAKVMASLNQHRDLFEQRHEQLVWMLSEIDKMENSWFELPMHEELTGAQMNFGEKNMDDVSVMPNAVLHFREDFDDLVKQPSGSIQDKYSELLRFSRGRILPVDDLVEIVSHRSLAFLYPREVEEFLKIWKPLRFVWVSRFKTVTPPAVDPFNGSKFQPGYVSAESIGFDLYDKRILGWFEFAATNEDRIDYSFLEGTGREIEAQTAVTRDLATNLEWVFFKRLKELAPETRVPVDLDKTPPFSEQSLEEAKQHSKLKRK